MRTSGVLRTRASGRDPRGVKEVRMRRLSAIVTLAVGLGAIDGAALGAERVTILYDAFGKASAPTTDWGFAALVEVGGKRILFDTGNDAAVLERNLAVAGIDLTSVDSVVISHRHSDHVAGLAARGESRGYE